MSRSIVRSKINAKYNPVQTGGGGGGSAIAVYNEAALLTANVTSFTFTGLGIDATAAGNAVTVTVNNNEVIEVKNATGSTIPKGAVCYINVLGGSGTHPEILLASAATESTSSKTIGVTADAITPGSIGLLIINGEITGTGAAPLDTSAYNAGAMLWLSNTPGQWTTTIPPFPSHSVFIGHVTRSQATNGRVVIKIQNGYEVQELHDAVIGTKVHGQFLMLDTVTYSPNPAWVNQRLVTSITVAQLIALRNNAQLVPGMTYDVTDALILSYITNANKKFYIRAVDTAKLESCGTIELLESVVPNLTFRPIECWYDLNINNFLKLHDAHNKNTIEGWNNIISFLTMCSGNLLNSNYSNNVIINNSSFSGTTSITSFRNNYVHNSTLNLNAFTGVFQDNYLETSTVNFSNCSIASVLKNVISTSTVVFQPSNSLQNFNENNIKHSSVSATGLVSNFFDCNNNNINQSTVVFAEATLNYFTNNSIHTNSLITIGSGSVMSTFGNNFIDDSSITVSGPLTNSSNVISNEFYKSIINTYDCELNNCNIFGMGLGSVASFNVTTSYSYCNYRLLEDSTFYVVYDLDDPTIYNGTLQEITIPTNHETWIGKITLTSTLGATTITVKSIVNPVLNHQYRLYKDATFTRLDVVVTSGFFLLPLALAGTLQLFTDYDFGYFDPRPYPIGTQLAGEHVLTHYELY